MEKIVSGDCRSIDGGIRDLEEQCEDEGAEHDGPEPDYDNECEGQSIPGGAGL